jgi:hypothetical protein
MNKQELFHVVQLFMNKYKTSKSKRQYAEMLIKNFESFHGDNIESVHSNIAQKGNTTLNRLLN